MNRAYDVVVIGSGFGGSLTALVLHALGNNVVVLDRSSHPRFRIGESSTPLADQSLRRLAERFQLPWLTPLVCYGTASSIDEIVVGAKRGFSYFQHSKGTPYRAGEDHQHELIVAASATAATSDTHWHRATVDAWFARHLAEHQIALHEHYTIEKLNFTPQRRWRISGTRHDSPLPIEADFVIDASGRRGLVLDHLNIRRSPDTLQTRSHAIYGHFADLTPWHELLDPASRSEHPFPCDQAAVHHLLDEGWMWQLGFDNGITSCGIVFAQDAPPPDNPHKLWQHTLSQYPTLARQFQQSRIVAPANGLVSSGRLQFIADRCAGDHWLSLPATAGFIDPLHSTGIAHTVSAIETIAEIFAASPCGAPAPNALRAYDTRLRREIRWIDRLVSTCYAARVDFELFVIATMLYFTAATFGEQVTDNGVVQNGFLGANHEALRQSIESVADRIHIAAADNPTAETVREIAAFAQQTLAPFNHVGLFAPPINHMYSSTAASKSL